MNFPLSVSPNKKKRRPHEAKKKVSDLDGNRTRGNLNNRSDFASGPLRETIYPYRMIMGSQR